jgi:hypothetical protein
MELDVDVLINFFKKNTFSDRFELDEDEGVSSEPSPPPPSSSSSLGGGGSTGGSGKTPKKWESGISRGKSNPIANTLWSSGRNFGKTYMNDPKYVWDSGVSRGKANPLDY